MKGYYSSHGRRTWGWFLGAMLGLILAGCGEVGGSGQCNGVDVIGACVTIDSIQARDAVNAADTTSVDVSQNADCDGDPTTVDPEKWGDHSGSVTVSLALMPGVDSPPAPAFVTLTSYTVEYFPSPTNTVSAPPLTTMAFSASNVKVNAGESVTTSLQLVPTQTKVEYRNSGGSLVPAAIYTAAYTIHGTSQFNQDFVLKGQVGIELGSFDNCQ